MRLTVDRERCMSAALCTGLAPDAFEMDEDGRLVVLQETPAPDAADDVREAVRACPVQALILSES